MNAVRLTFKPFSLVKVHITHALAAGKHAGTPAQREDMEPTGPGLVLARNSTGVHLSSNGRPTDLVPIYPIGMYPPANPRWADTAAGLFGDDYFEEALSLVGIGEHLLTAPDKAELVIEVGGEELTASILV